MALGNIFRSEADYLREELRSLARTGKWQERQQQAAAGDLQAQVDQLKLVCGTLVSLLIRKQVVRYEELEELARELDILDGQEDGKFRGCVKPTGEAIAQEGEPTDPPPVRWA